MLLKQISLNNFRNFDRHSFSFSSHLTVIIGENARGKTNLLEAIYFVINGTGFRESKEIELVNFANQKGADIEGLFDEKSLVSRFKVDLKVKDETLQKTYLINKTKKRHFQYLQNQTRCVLFTPQQIEILTGSPDRRRDYFNKLISLYDQEYKKRLDDFDKALRRRNKLLEYHKERSELEKEIVFWNDYLKEQAAYITQKRGEYILFLNQNNSIDSKKFSISYLKNEFTDEKVKQYFEKELVIRRTLFGPQKDDFEIAIEGRNVHRFGSRSEQRLTIFWLKINEILYYKWSSKKNPILLFDDIFSELDSKNKKLVLSLIGDYQTIATTTEKEVLNLANLPHEVIRL